MPTSEDYFYAPFTAPPSKNADYEPIFSLQSKVRFFIAMVLFYGGALFVSNAPNPAAPAESATPAAEGAPHAGAAADASALKTTVSKPTAARQQHKENFAASEIGTLPTALTLTYGIDTIEVNQAPYYPRDILLRDKFTRKIGFDPQTRQPAAGQGILPPPKITSEFAPRHGGWLPSNGRMPGGLDGFDILTKMRQHNFPRLSNSNSSQFAPRRLINK